MKKVFMVKHSELGLFWTGNGYWGSNAKIYSKIGHARLAISNAVSVDSDKAEVVECAITVLRTIPKESKK